MIIRIEISGKYFSFHHTQPAGGFDKVWFMAKTKKVIIYYPARGQVSCLFILMKLEQHHHGFNLKCVPRFPSVCKVIASEEALILSVGQFLVEFKAEGTVGKWGLVGDESRTV